MDRTSPVKRNFNRFVPLAGMGNPHLQTLLPRLIRRRILLQPHWQRLELPDGDFVDLAWSEDPAQARGKPRMVLFHGLEGSFHSPYTHGLLLACQARGRLGVVMHFRGCSGEPTACDASITPAKPAMHAISCTGCNSAGARCRPLRWVSHLAAICWPT